MRTVIIASLLAASSSAFAGVDYRPTITAPAGNTVYQTGRWYVNVGNVGNQNGTGGNVVIQLPRTNTSPQVYIMGTLGARSANCTVAGTAITCTLPSIRRNTSVSMYFDISFPESSAPLAISATTSNPSDTVTGNNTANAVANPLNVVVASPSGRTVLNQHCTGTNLTSYFECTLFPGSITSHTTVLNADFTVSFPGYAGYTGDWSQAAPDQLSFTYYDNGLPVAEFDGWGITPSCFEGITTFPGSTYVSPYRVCLQ